MVALSFLSGCIPKLKKHDNISSISGSIAKVISSNETGNSKVTNLSSTCNGQTISLYEIDSNGKKAKKIADSNIDKAGKFTFKDLKQVGIDLKKESENTKYILEVLCDSMAYQRFVTGNKEQNISPATTLIGWISQADSTVNIQGQNLNHWNDFYKQLDTADSFSSAFSTLNSNTTLKNKFISTFGIQPDVLLDAPPEILNVSIPNSFKEEVSQMLNVQSSHWSKDYNMAYEWKFNNQLLSNSANFTFTPTANSQGAYTVQLFIGQNDGSGLVDVNKPYIQKAYPITVLNTIPPTPPAMSLVGSGYISSNDVTVRIATGASIDGKPTHCKSFSKLALVEENFPAVGIAPTQPSAYNLTCNTNLTQDILTSLSGQEGIRTLRLWAQDESGTVSKQSPRCRGGLVT